MIPRPLLVVLLPITLAAGCFPSWGESLLEGHACAKNGDCIEGYACIRSVCERTDTHADAGAPRDSGSDGGRVVQDGGREPDGGARSDAGLDGGGWRDGGTDDGGTTDAGARSDGGGTQDGSQLDGGSSMRDGGAAIDDAGTPPRDAGPREPLPLCAPCTGVPDECGASNACIQSDGTAFCGRACSDGTECPLNYTCAVVVGSPTGQCAPMDGICGCVDQDSDGFGTGASCELPQDCNDLNAADYPGARERCDDTLDNDCDGSVDETCPSRSDLVAYYPLNGDLMPHDGTAAALGECAWTTDRFSAAEAACQLTSPAISLGMHAARSVQVWTRATSVGTVLVVEELNGSPFLKLAFESDALHLAVAPFFQDEVVPGSLQEGAWHQVVLVLSPDPGNPLAVYVDGVRLVDLNGSQPSEPFRWFLGSPDPARYADPFQGEIDDVRLYEGSLLDADVQALYFEGGF